MAERKSFLLRMDRELLDAVQRWANDDLRSLNGQIEFLLRRALQQAGRKPLASTPADFNTLVDHEGES
ncbi:MAG: Arc family DNA-binding protein [Gemmatimonadaceae bacterium]|nr:Arc family DNA-binding protein [Gemmatimonadaceae bacterium]